MKLIVSKKWALGNQGLRSATPNFASKNWCYSYSSLQRYGLFWSWRQKSSLLRREYTWLDSPVQVDGIPWTWYANHFSYWIQRAMNFQVNSDCRHFHFDQLYRARTCTTVFLEAYRFIWCTCYVWEVVPDRSFILSPKNWCLITQNSNILHWAMYQPIAFLQISSNLTKHSYGHSELWLHLGRHMTT